MRVKLLTALTAIFFCLFSCENEPYNTAPLKVISFQNITDKILYSYQYKQKKLSLFKAVNQSTGATITQSKFYYEDGLLSKIVSDSTEESYKLTQITINDSRVSLDSTFLISGEEKSLVFTRAFVYSENTEVIKISTKEWIENTVSEKEFELTWTNGNVSAVTEFLIGDTIEKTDSVFIEYDNKAGIYTNDFEYFYTLAEELWLLSKNNPILFKREGQADRKYTYSYNKFDYPSQFKNHEDVTFGVSYTEIK